MILELYLYTLHITVKALIVLLTIDDYNFYYLSIYNIFEKKEWRKQSNSFSYYDKNNLENYKPIILIALIVESFSVNAFDNEMLSSFKIKIKIVL